MDQGNDSAGTKSEIAETDPDIDQDADGRNNNRYYRRPSHLAADSTADILLSDRLIRIDAVFLAQSITHIASLLCSQNRSLDDDLIASGYILELYIRGSSVLLEDLHKLLLICARNIQGLIEHNSHSCTAGEVKAVIEGLAAGSRMDTHGDKTDHDQDNGDRIGNLFEIEIISDLGLLHPAVILDILKTDAVEGINQNTCHDQCREQRQHNTQCQGNGETADGTGTHHIKDGCCDQGCDITVQNGGKSLVKTNLDGFTHTVACGNLLTDTCEDNDIGVNRHTDGQDDTRHTGQSQCDVQTVQEAHQRSNVKCQSDRCCQTGNPVKNDHEDHDDDQADQTCKEAGTHCIGSQLGADYLGADLGKAEFEFTGTDGCRKGIGTLISEIALDDALTVGNGLIDSGRTDDFSVINDVNGLADIAGCRIRKGFCSLIIKHQRNDILLVAVIIRLRSCLRTLDMVAVEHLKISFENLFSGRLLTGTLTETDGTGIAQHRKNLLCIIYTGDINIDPVDSLLVYLCLCTVGSYSLLQLINGITHILSRRILFICLISNVDTARQVQAQFDIFRCSDVILTVTDCGNISAGQNHHDHRDKRDPAPLFTTHLPLLLLPLPQQLLSLLHTPHAYASSHIRLRKHL